ncbi:MULTISPECIES: hypothetical protein [unclassified Streptomyces]|uniref:hypothetical protein n=1 Tax=unclassified Streptomyces TaxID=2593676 RepID=UPI0011108623|nr:MULTISPECIES: hypothetical protein [unclassified Streptomyces]MCI3928397.1 hypothetical protein [Streptomyces sp. AN091965]QCX74301.1 hypothetical protein C9F11_02990 [Streptomyces sp. YIM 121038]
MDPLSLIAAIAFFGYIAVVIVSITVEIITEWFRARGRIKADNANAIAFSLAERIANKDYAKVGGVFDKTPTTASTRIVQGFFDERTGRVVQARALASARQPDAAVVRHHAAGRGLVVYT